MLIYATMLACAALLILLVRRYDLYEREPWYMLLAAVAIGVGAMWVVGQIEDIVLGRLHISSRNLALKAAVVTVIEEGAKLGVVALFALLFRRHFNNVLDGVVYGTLGGLGMAIEESLMYMRFAYEKNLHLLGAEVIRLLAHSLMGGLLGFALALLIFRPMRRRRHALLPLLAVATAVIVHFSWDFIAYQPYISPVLRGSLMLLMLSLMLVWGLMVAFATDVVVGQPA